MTNKRQFLSEILEGAKDELLLLGFVKEESGYTYPLNQETKGWLGLGTTGNEGPTRVGVYPVLGVIHQTIERFVQEFNGENVFRVTLSTNLGYVMPERKFLTWIFEASPFAWVDEMRTMVEAVEVYGVAFMKSHSTLQAIIDDLEHHRYVDRDSAAYRLPLAYVLAGKADLAAEYVKKYLAGLGGRTDLAALKYKAFALKLLKEAVLG